MKLKILIVEDHDISALFLTEIIQNLAREILYATNGIKGIEHFRNHSDIDLILMDIKLPDINGYEVTRQIRLFNKDIIIIAQTAFAQNGEEEKALSAGCNYYITKPINKTDLLNLIKSIFKIDLNTTQKKV
ncbi:response regulator [Lutibacter sp.]|uniref:response regulator n=1 Tax=Lutibacter sp. TaxID=1925666 RepID=UPI003563637A